jgi:polyhydroxybutyrate depolymerase
MIGRAGGAVLCLLLVVSCADPDGDEDGEATPTTTSAPASTSSAGGGVEVVEREMETTDGEVRRYRVHVPAQTEDGEGPRLVVALHGGGGSAAQFEAASGVAELATTAGVIVVVPEGSGGGLTGAGVQTWNAGECCGPAARDGVDDVGAIREVIEEVVSEHGADAERVLVIGHSNGAAMAYRLACELSDHVVAIGVQAGPLGVDGCAPTRPVSVLHIHGADDVNVPIDGGAGQGVSGVDFSPVRAGLSTLAEVAGCEGEPVVEVEEGEPRVDVERWTGCEQGAEVELRIVEGAAHAWMGIDGAGGRGGTAGVGYDATAEIWEFLSRVAA